MILLSYKDEDVYISVIVPIYNAEQFLTKCINSIVQQTYECLEILLVDDGSTDDSLKICQNYEKLDSRVKVIHKQNAGIVAARRTGIEQATGTYITFVDSDDYIDKNAYEDILNMLDMSKPDLVAYGLIEECFTHILKKENKFKCKVYYRDEIEEILFPKMLNYDKFFDFGILPNLVCKLIKKSFFENIKVEISDCITVGEDVDMTFQLLVNAESVQLMNVCPYHYCKRDDSMMWKMISPDSISSLEYDLKKAFIRAGCEKIMRKQLMDYIAFVSLLKNPKILLDDYEIFQDKRVALYGAGGFGQAVYGTYGETITLWVDNNFEKYKNSEFTVFPIQELKLCELEYDIIFIAILDTDVCYKVKSKLIEMGIQKDIFYYER